MNIKYLIEGIVAFILGIILLVWFIRKPLYNKNEEEADDRGIDEAYWSAKFDKANDFGGYMGALMMIILGLILIYKGITGG